MRNSEHAVKLYDLAALREKRRPKKKDNRVQYLVRTPIGSVRHAIIEAAIQSEAADHDGKRAVTSTITRGMYALCCAKEQGWDQMVDGNGTLNDLHKQIMTEAAERYGIDDKATALEAALRIALDVIQSDEDGTLITEIKEYQQVTPVTTTPEGLSLQQDKVVTTTTEPCSDTDLQVPEIMASGLSLHEASTILDCIQHRQHIPRARVLLSVSQSIRPTRMRAEAPLGHSEFSEQELDACHAAWREWHLEAKLSGVSIARLRSAKACRPKIADVLRDTQLEPRDLIEAIGCIKEIRPVEFAARTFWKFGDLAEKKAGEKYTRAQRLLFGEFDPRPQLKAEPPRESREDTPKRPTNDAPQTSRRAEPVEPPRGTQGALAPVVNLHQRSEPHPDARALLNHCGDTPPLIGDLDLLHSVAWAVNNYPTKGRRTLVHYAWVRFLEPLGLTEADLERAMEEPKTSARRAGGTP